MQLTVLTSSPEPWYRWYCKTKHHRSVLTMSLNHCVLMHFTRKRHLHISTIRLAKLLTSGFSNALTYEMDINAVHAQRPQTGIW